jgi:hypothetical protein
MLIDKQYAPFIIHGVHLKCIYSPCKRSLKLIITSRLSINTHYHFANQSSFKMYADSCYREKKYIKPVLPFYISPLYVWCLCTPYSLNRNSS